jgi:hypothetical protein
MTVHGIDEFMDDLRRTWCGINLAPGDPRPADNASVDCMTCLVHVARRSTNRNGDIIGRVVSVNSDGSVVMEIP